MKGATLDTRLHIHNRSAFDRRCRCSSFRFISEMRQAVVGPGMSKDRFTDTAASSYYGSFLMSEEPTCSRSTMLVQQT